MTDVLTFLRAIDVPSLSMGDRARAVLWWVGREDENIGLSGSKICKLIAEAGHHSQNITRLNSQLSADKRRVSRIPGQDAWRLHPRGRQELDSLYESVATSPRKPRPTDSVIPRSLFANTRTYIEKVVFQINASYDNGLYDCCAVMCRRLLETLLIEIYDAAGRSNDIKGSDGNYLMFADLLRIFEADAAFHLSRNGKQGLRDFKKLGDLAAHNRRFNARKEDIDKVSSGLRVSTEELLHLAKLA